MSWRITHDVKCLFQISNLNISCSSSQKHWFIDLISRGPRSNLTLAILSQITQRCSRHKTEQIYRHGGLMIQLLDEIAGIELKRDSGSISLDYNRNAQMKVRWSKWGLRFRGHVRLNICHWFGIQLRKEKDEKTRTFDQMSVDKSTFNMRLALWWRISICVRMTPHSYSVNDLLLLNETNKNTKNMKSCNGILQKWSLEFSGIGKLP